MSAHPTLSDIIRRRLALGPANRAQLAEACNVNQDALRNCLRSLRREGHIETQDRPGGVLYVLLQPVLARPSADPLQQDILDMLRNRGPLSEEELRNALTVASARRWDAALRPLISARRVVRVKDGLRAQAGRSRPGVLAVLAAIAALQALVWVPACVELQRRPPVPQTQPVSSAEVWA